MSLLFDYRMKDIQNHVDDRVLVSNREKPHLIILKDYNLSALYRNISAKILKVLTFLDILRGTAFSHIETGRKYAMLYQNIRGPTTSIGITFENFTSPMYNVF